jgi:hypothetical protein
VWAAPYLTTWELLVSQSISMTMHRALDLIAITDPTQLPNEAKNLPESRPLRRVDELLTRCLYDIEHAERVMRTELAALKTAADREIEHLNQGYATGDWPLRYAGKAEAGRQQLVRTFEQLNLLTVLRRLLHTRSQPAAPPADPEPQAEAGT